MCAGKENWFRGELIEDHLALTGRIGETEGLIEEDYGLLGYGAVLAFGGLDELLVGGEGEIADLEGGHVVIGA